MSAAALEAFVARLYTDAALRQDFIARPEAVAQAAGLDAATARRLADTDLEGLVLAADSFAHKRAAHAAKPRKRPWFHWLRWRSGSRG